MWMKSFRRLSLGRILIQFCYPLTVLVPDNMCETHLVGGTPVQSNLIFQRIKQLAKDNNKKVYTFIEDVAASGGYYIACAGDEIYADESSIVGSIGVVTQSFGVPVYYI